MTNTELLTLRNRLTTLGANLSRLDFNKKKIVATIREASVDSSLGDLNIKYFNHFKRVLSYDIEKVLDYTGGKGYIYDLRKFIILRCNELNLEIKKNK